MRSPLLVLASVLSLSIGCGGDPAGPAPAAQTRESSLALRREGAPRGTDDLVLVGPWSATGSLTYPHVSTAAALLPSGKVLLASGFGVDWSPSAEIYDPTAGLWSLAAPLKVGRAGHTATLLPSGKVLVSGGYDGASYPASELYDPATNTWSSAGVMLTPRSIHTATLLPSGKVLIAGGSSYSGLNNGPIAAAEL